MISLVSILISFTSNLSLISLTDSTTGDTSITVSSSFMNLDSFFDSGNRNIFGSLVSLTSKSGPNFAVFKSILRIFSLRDLTSSVLSICLTILSNSSSDTLSVLSLFSSLFLSRILLIESLITSLVIIEFTLMISLVKASTTLSTISSNENDLSQFSLNHLASFSGSIS